MTEHDTLYARTANTGEIINQAPASNAGNNVGERLRQARLARNLTIEEVAGQLHLQVRHLDALEQQDLSRLPGASYICGYLRSYAKFLHLPSNEIVENYPGVREHIAGVKSTVVSTKLYTQRTFEPSGPRPAWLGAVGLLAALLLGGWIVFQMSNRPATQTTAVAPARVPKDSIPESVAPPAPARNLAPSAGANVGIAVEESPTAPVNTVTPDVVAALPPSTPVAALVLEFSGDSWVEIYDADERRLVNEAVHAGETRVVKGQAPFKLMLGAVKSVQVRLNGTRFDMTSYQQREAAVFQVGSEQDNRMESGGE